MRLLPLLAARLDELSRRLDGAAPELVAEVRELAELAGGLDPYLAAGTTPESPALAELARVVVRLLLSGESGAGA